MSMQFVVGYYRPLFDCGRSKLIGCFVQRLNGAPFDKAALKIHHMSFHSNGRKHWKLAEKRLHERFAPDLCRLVRMKIKTERL